MDAEEVRRFMRVWGVAISSALYCYTLASKTKPGIQRAVLVAPVVVLFITLPFALDSINLGAPTFFYLAWLGNFKLLLFAHGSGPLVPRPNDKPLSLVHFIAIALLPIKIKHTTTLSPSPPQERKICTWRKIRKLLAFLLATKLLTCNRMFSPLLVQVLYFVHVSLGMEMVLAVTAFPVISLLGLRLEDQFRYPYLATSLQDFWGNRWNLMASNILRLTVYTPLKRITSPMLGKLWGVIVGIIGSFIVSGFMHELTYYHYTRVSPTWEVTWFFILQGVCTATEVCIKIKYFSNNKSWQPPRLISMFLTICFVASTASWLFVPPLLRNKVNERLLHEYFTVYDFIKTVV